MCKKCGPASWIFCDRAAKAETCHLCGGRWPKYKEQPSSKPERVWRSQQAVQPKGFRQDGKIHKALHFLWEKFTPEVQQGLVAAGWKPKAEPKLEAPPGLPRLGAGGHLGKGKGKGKQSEPAEHDSAHQALWESASSEQRAWLHQLGFQCPSPSEPSDLKTLINAHMDQLPETLRQAIASLEPPEPEPSATEQVLSATKKFKASTNELRQLIQKSAGLQVKIDRAKATYADLLDQMKAVQTELADKQLEVTKLQKELESKVQSGAGLPILPGKEAVLLALTQCGITLSSEQQALLEGSMDVEPAPLVAPKPHNTEEEMLASAPQPQGAQPPADWPDGPREGKHRSRSRGRAQGQGSEGTPGVFLGLLGRSWVQPVLAVVSVSSLSSETMPPLPLRSPQCLCNAFRMKPLQCKLCLMEVHLARFPGLQFWKIRFLKTLSSCVLFVLRR